MLAEMVTAPGWSTLELMTAVPVPSAPIATVAVVVPVAANVAVPLAIVRVALVKGVPVTTTVRVVPAQVVARRHRRRRRCSRPCPHLRRG